MRSFCLLLSYSLHKALTCKHRSSAEQEYLRACLPHVKPEEYLNAFKKVVSQHRPYLVKQGIGTHIALLLDDEPA